MNKNTIHSAIIAAGLSSAMMLLALPAFASTPTTPIAHTQATGTTSHAAAADHGKVNPTAIAAGFATLNLTSYKMTETSHSIDGQFNGQEPYDGTVTWPGFTSSWGIVDWPNDSNVAYIRYELNDPWHTHFEVRSDFGDADSISINDNETDAGFYSHYTPVVNYRSDGSEWMTIEAAGHHTYNLTGAQAQQQYQTLKTLGNGGDVHYNFDQTGYQHDVMSAPQVAGAAQQNINDPLPTTNSFAASDSIATTTTWSATATVGADIAGIVKVEASASYGQSYAQDHTETATETMSINEGYAGWFTVQNPVDRVTGNFTITVGNDTWNLTGVGFDLPLTGGDYTAHYNAQVAPIGSPNIPQIIHT